MTSLGLLHDLTLFVCFLALFAGSYAIACVPAIQPNTLGIRGLKRVQAMQNSALFAAVEPCLRWFGMQLRRVLSQRLCDWLDRGITLAGDFLGLLSEEFIALCLLCGGIGFGVGAGYSFFCAKSMLYALAGFTLGCLVPYSRLTEAQVKRRKRVNNGLPPAVDLLALSLSAGLDFPGALRQVVEKSSSPNDPLIEEIGFLLQELQVGKTRRAALYQFAERVPTETVREFVSAVTQAEERGNPLARVLQIQAGVSRQQRSIRAEEAAARAGVKMIVPMVMVFGAILILIAGPMFLSIRASLLAE